MSACTHILDSDLRKAWKGDSGLAAALFLHSYWFQGDYSLWTATRTRTVHLRKNNG